VYLRNCWYIAALTEEVSNKPLARMFLGEAVVLFRGADGAVVALEDRCCHRSLPLSMGSIVEGNLQCGYHGLAFDTSGVCVKVPGQSRVPPGAEVRKYPLVERYNWLWIWMGDADAADPAAIPDIFWREDPGWTAWGSHWLVECAYNLLIDIQLDNTHAPFVHPDTLGSSAITDTPPIIERSITSVSASRWMMNVVPSPTFARALGSDGNVDRWLLWRFSPPSLCAFDIGCAHAGTGAETGDRSNGVTLHTAHFMTPQTETSCHYFWSVGRNYKISDIDITRAMNDEFTQIFSGDVDIVEAQQRSPDLVQDWQPIDIAADAPVLQARNILKTLIDEEVRP
jgi:vanillate O-demethylase monooxygenase subunit